MKGLPLGGIPPTWEPSFPLSALTHDVVGLPPRAASPFPPAGWPGSGSGDVSLAPVASPQPEILGIHLDVCVRP